MADLILMVLILAIFSEISLEICLAVAEAAAGNSKGPMKGASIRKTVRITFEEAVFGCEKELDVILKDPCPDCHGTGAKPGTSPETCRKVWWKRSGCIYTAVIVWYGAECTDLSGLWRNR